MSETTENKTKQGLDPLWSAGAAVLLAGALHVAERMPFRYLQDVPSATPAAFTLLPFAATVLFLLTNGIYLALLAAWTASVYRRLLPQRSRSCILAGVGFMLLLLALRMAKYRVFENVLPAERLCWYAYYVPISFLPVLFLMLGLEINGGRRRVPPLLLLLPAAVFSLLFLTNDLHHFAFSTVNPDAVAGYPGAYRYGLLYYIFLVCAVGAAAAAFVLLFRATVNRAGWRAAVLSLGAVTVVLAVLIAGEELLRKNNLESILPYLFPELAVFGIIGIVETCIRNRLIPYNENYVGFFASLQLPAWITDRQFATRFQTAHTAAADEEQMRRALSESVELDEDTTLSGRDLTAGYVFYAEDQSALHRMNEKLEDANELLAQENALIRAENDVKEQTERTRYRARLYAQIAETLYPKQREIAALLDSAEPGEPSFRSTVAQVAVRNAYVKRATNLLLLREEPTGQAAEALASAMRESAKYFAYAGVAMSVADCRGEPAKTADGFALYTAFEEICEALMPYTKHIHAALHDGGLRLVADCAEAPQLPPTVEVLFSEGLYYLTVRAGGDAA